MSIITDPGGTSDACSNVQSGQFATFKVPSESSPSGAEVLFLACAFMTTRSDTAMLQMLASQHFTAINPCYPNQRNCRDWVYSKLWKRWRLALAFDPPEVLLRNRMGSVPRERAKSKFNMAEDYQVVF